jgi:hypothetical protein
MDGLEEAEREHWRENYQTAWATLRMFCALRDDS